MRVSTAECPFVAPRIESRGGLPKRHFNERDQSASAVLLTVGLPSVLAKGKWAWVRFPESDRPLVILRPRPCQDREIGCIYPNYPCLHTLQPVISFSGNDFRRRAVSLCQQTIVHTSEILRRGTGEMQLIFRICSFACVKDSLKRG